MEKTDYSTIKDYKELSLEIDRIQVRIEQKRSRFWVPFALAAIRSLKTFLSK